MVVIIVCNLRIKTISLLFFLINKHIFRKSFLIKSPTICNMSIKIIGAGFPRTGTNTLRESLELLGFGKTYHMKNLLVNPENLHYWLTLKETGTTDWEALYDGYQSTVDFPCYPWYKEHMKQYPDAKVILSLRPFEKWYESYYSTIYQSHYPSAERKAEMEKKVAESPQLQKVMPVMGLAKQTITEEHFQGRFLDKDFMEKTFNDHNEAVKNYVPANKLLVFDVCEGWEPLCAFLNVNVPAEPLPHTNKKEDFAAMVQELMKGHMA